MADETPATVEISAAYDLGAAAAHELVYLDRNGMRPIRLAVGTDLFNAACGFVNTMAIRSPDSDFAAIRTGCTASPQAHARFLRCIGEHFLALSDFFQPQPAERPAAQAELLLLAQSQPAPIPVTSEDGAQPDLLPDALEHAPGQEVASSTGAATC